MTLGFSNGFLIRSREPNTSYTTMKSNSPEEEQVAGLAHCFSCHCCCRVKLSWGLALLVIFLLLGSSHFATSAAGLGFDSTTSRGGLGPSSSRRVLHEPLFPIVHSPAPAPTPGSSESQSPPQIPFSNQQPFFPLSSPPPPPPPDPSSDTSIPVNPKKDSGNNKSNTKNKNTVIGVIVSLCTIGALGGLIFFLHHRRKKRDPWASNHTFLDETPLTGPHGQNGSGNLRVFQVPSPVTSKLAVNGGSDVLYLGTMEPLANSHRTQDEDTNKDMDSHDRDEETHMLHCHARKQNYNSDDYRSNSKDDNVDDNHDAGKNNNASTFGIAKGNGDVDRFQRRTSPEVHPLPPLSKKPYHTRTSVCSDSSDEDSFYSPRCPSSSSSRSNNDSSPRVSACKRLFSPPQQQPSIVSLKSESTHSYPSSSATSSGTSSPSALDSPPCAPINPCPPITPSLVTPPIRSHLHSHSSPSHHSPNQQSQNPPPPPPPPPPPLFQSPLSPISHSAKPKPDQKSSPLYSSPAIEKSNLISIPALSDSKSRKSSPSGFSKTPPTSSTGRGTSSPPTAASPPSRRSPHSPLPPLPTRPPPPFLSSSRSGRVSQPSSLSPNCPPPPPPPPTQNKPSPPEMLPPLPSRPSYRPHSGLYSSRTGQSLQPLAPNSEDAEEQQSTPGTNGTPRPKLKPLHWDKVRASPDRAMVWDQLKSGSFKLNEEMIETLFVYNTPTQVKGEGTKRSTPTPPPLNQRILESKKSQNIAILLRALSVTKEEVCDALLEGASDNLSTELLETLSKMAPSKEEEIRLKEYNGDTSKLGPAERFLKAVLDIPFAFKRVDALLYRANFKEEINYIRKSFETLEAACEELRSSRLFLKLLEAVLKTGNRMNVGTIRGDAQAFKLDTLLKLVDVKGTDGKTTLLHFVVQEIIKAEGARVACPGEQPIPNSASDIINDKLHDLGTQVQSQKEKEDEYRKLGLQVVAGLSTEMNNVKKAAGIDSDALSNSISKLATGLGKLRETLQMDETIHSKDGKVEGSSKQGNFHRSVESFLQQAVEDIHRIQDEEKKAFSRVREITEYFHGDAGKEEAHPLRFFVVVRDFLGVLDQVCREIGRTQTKNSLSSVRPYPISAPISVPVSVQAFSRPFPRGFYDRRPDSSDEESLSP